MNRRRHSVSQRVGWCIAAATALVVPAMAADSPPFHSLPLAVANLAAASDVLVFTAPRPFENKIDLWRALPSGGLELAASPLFEHQRPHAMHSGHGVAFLTAAGRVWRIAAADGPIETVETAGPWTPLGSAANRFFALEASPSGPGQAIELVATAAGEPLEILRLGRVGVRAPAATPISSTELVAHRGEWVFGVSGSRPSDQALDGIWTTNGTVNGTRQLVSLAAICGAPCRVERIASNGTRLFFSTGDGLWALAPSGPPVRFASLSPPSPPALGGFSGFGDMTAIGRYLFFAAHTGAHGTELWFSDGTAKRTRLFRSLRPGLASSGPEQLVTIGNRFFFIANDGARGRELWTSNGTRAGTRRLTDVAAGAADGIASGQRLARLPGGVAFVATSAANGTEPWVSDGTPAGTSLLADVKPGPNGSNPAGFTAAAGRIYFKASGENGDSLIGVEHPSAGGSTP
jgi:ELWxxDGT repeat protein